MAGSLETDRLVRRYPDRHRAANHVLPEARRLVAQTNVERAILHRDAAATASATDPPLDAAIRARYPASKGLRD
ncbi:MAG: hypothetical protein WKF46_08305, partial [Candidatus Limnocylindrales bacterium]